MLRAEVRHHLIDLTPAWTAAAARASLFLREPYLSYANVGHGSVFRAECLAGNVLVAGVTGWLANGDGHSFVEPSRLFASGTQAGPCLVVSCPGAFTGALLRNETSSSTPSLEIVAALREAIAQHASKMGATGVFALYMNDDDIEFLTAGEQAFPALMNFDAVIDVPDSLEGYLSLLPRHRRGNLRREMRTFEDSGMTGGVLQANFRELFCELTPILVASEARFGHEMSEGAVMEMLERQSTMLKDNFVVFTARNASGRLLAAATAYLDEDTVNLRISGVDREHGGNHFEYFHVGYYLPIAFAARTGRKYVRLGMESFEAKLMRGARLEPRWGAPLCLNGFPQHRWQDQVSTSSQAALTRLDALLERFPEGMTREVHARCMQRVANN